MGSPGEDTSSTQKAKMKCRGGETSNKIIRGMILSTKDNPSRNSKMFIYLNKLDSSVTLLIYFQSNEVFGENFV